MLFFTLFSNSETGPINSILLKLGIVAEPVRWLSNVWTARGLVGLMNFLMWFGNTTIILMAAIMGVDPGLYEAAQLDGASSTTMFWRITIPLIRPLLVYTLITSLIGGLQMFDVPQVLDVYKRQVYKDRTEKAAAHCGLLLCGKRRAVSP